MPTTQTDNKAHQAAANAAEMTRQQAERAAIAAGGSSAVVQAAVTAVAVTYYRSIRASAIANSLPEATASASSALKALGTDGS